MTTLMFTWPTLALNRAVATTGHVHHNGYQLLLVTAGKGWYQEFGKPAQKLHPGDAVAIHEGVKHWHGATKDFWFSHIAITKGSSEWLEEVSDADYAKLAD